MRSARKSHLLWLALFTGIGPLCPTARAIVTYGTAGYNVPPAPGNVDQYEGIFDGVAGTPITSNMMVTAAHIFPATNNVPFVFNNGTNTPTTYAVQVVATLDDLAVWEIAPNSGQSFSLTAPMYTGNSETGLSMVDVGRGYGQGSAVTGGWAWNTDTQPTGLSWGTNTVASVDTDTSIGAGGNFGGDFLQYNFDPSPTNENECIVAKGDSGGGVFVDVNGTYELDGVNSFFGVRVPMGDTDYVYNLTDANQNVLSDALYDTQNYYAWDGYTSDAPTKITTAIPESSYATRISSKQNFIGLADGSISAANAAANTINDDGLLTVYSNLTTGGITGGAQLSVGPYGGVFMTIASNSATSELTSLAIAPASRLDITNNKIMISYGSPDNDPISSIAALIDTGYNNGGWNGVGIYSTTAQANFKSYGIGYADSADPGNPAGLAAGTVEIMYTLLGDANLDGKVNGTDFTLMATNFNHAVTNGWDQGDFNYDGVVNGADFVLLAENFNQYASESADIAALNAFVTANGLGADLPEPASAGLLLAGALCLLHRRNLQAARRL